MVGKGAKLAEREREKEREMERGGESAPGTRDAPGRRRKVSWNLSHSWELQCFGCATKHIFSATECVYEILICGLAWTPDHKSAVLDT